MNDAVGILELAIIEESADLSGTDEFLAASARTGDESAFEQLFERHKRRIGRIAGRFFNKPETIEEIVQETFTKLYFSLDRYSDQQGSSFSAWLSRIAINTCYDQLRRLRRRPEGMLGNVADDEMSWFKSRLAGAGVEPTAESAVISRDLADKLLARLAPEDRLVLTLLDGEGSSVSDIAEITGWSASKVKVRAHRARASLRRVLGEFV
jgi:RNA polymerase sigma-70 factor (ECF subfamily)